MKIRNEEWNCRRCSFLQFYKMIALYNLKSKPHQIFINNLSYCLLLYYAGNLDIREEVNHSSILNLDDFSTNKHIYRKINQWIKESRILAPISLIYSQNFLGPLVPANGDSMMLRNVCNYSPVPGLYYPVKFRFPENALWALQTSRCSVQCDPIIFHEVMEPEYTYIATPCKPRCWVVNATFRPLNPQRRAPFTLYKKLSGPCIFIVPCIVIFYGITNRFNCTQWILFLCLVHSTCFGRHTRPSSGVQRSTVSTANGTIIGWRRLSRLLFPSGARHHREQVAVTTYANLWLYHWL